MLLVKRDDLIWSENENISKKSISTILHPDHLSFSMVLKIEMENKLRQYVSLISILILILKGAALMCILDPGPNSDYMKTKTDIERSSTNKMYPVVLILVRILILWKWKLI